MGARAGACRLHQPAAAHQVGQRHHCLYAGLDDLADVTGSISGGSWKGSGSEGGIGSRAGLEEASAWPTSRILFPRVSAQGLRQQLLDRPCWAANGSLIYHLWKGREAGCFYFLPPSSPPSDLTPSHPRIEAPKTPPSIHLIHPHHHHHHTRYGYYF